MYPPDNAAPAPYVRELATRLSSVHEVTIVAYTRLPEPIPGVTIVAIDKRSPLLVRLVRYFFALHSAARHADIMYAENGPSVELPATLVSILTGTPFVLHIGDAVAQGRMTTSATLRFISAFARKHAATVLSTSPLAKPEILPLLPRPIEEEHEYEMSWKEHLATIGKILNHD